MCRQEAQTKNKSQDYEIQKSSEKVVGVINMDFEPLNDNPYGDFFDRYLDDLVV
jgi:hypothetical protein